MQVNAEKIERLDELINQYIEKGKKIADVQITRLTAPNENFGSTILKVDMLLKDNQDKSNTLSVVAKLIPENEFLQKIFKVPISFKMESAFYSIIIPTLQEFQREHRVTDVIDFFPKYYGSRNNLDGNDKVDANAVLLLENLKVVGKCKTSFFIVRYSTVRTAFDFKINKK